MLMKKSLFHFTARAMTKEVTIDIAKEMPRTYKQFPNDVLLSAAIMGDQEAREERLIREIMAVDGLSW